MIGEGATTHSDGVANEAPIFIPGFCAFVLERGSASGYDDR